MCKHNRIRINDIDICVKCGLCVCEGRFLIIDKKLLKKIGKGLK